MNLFCKVNAIAFLSIGWVAHVLANQCSVITDQDELSQIRENAQMFGSYSDGWILAEEGEMQCLPWKDSNDLLCTTKGAATLITMNKKRDFVSGIRVVGDQYSEFFARDDGSFECSDTQHNVAELKKRLGPPQDACNIFDDTVRVYETIEQSILVEEQNGAKLYKKVGNMKCEKDKENAIVCLTDDSVEVVYETPGEPPKGIETFGVEMVEMRFEPSGGLGCGSLEELQRYR